MKTKIVIVNILTGCGLLWLTGCETEQRTIFKGPYHVRFTESSDFKKESFSDTISIEVHVVGPALDEPVAIGYDIGGSAREGIDFVILDERGSIAIAPGEYFGHINFLLINNANNILRSQDIEFTLAYATNGALEIGQGVGGIGKTFIFTIFDDCILGGSYIQEMLSYEFEDITVTSTDCESYLVSDLLIIVDNSAFGIDLEITDNGDNTITVPQQSSDGLPEDEDTITGTGIYNPVDGSIIITITLPDMENQPEVSFTLIPDS